MAGRSQSFHDVTALAVRSTFPQNSNSMTLRICRKEWTSENGYVDVEEEICLFFADRATLDAMLAALPHTSDFVVHREEQLAAAEE